MSRVYFVQAVSGGPIKIGVAADLQTRFSNLQTGCPIPLVLLAHRPGSVRVERALHRKLAADRLHGEWFSPSAAVLAEIADALAHDQTLCPRQSREFMAKSLDQRECEENTARFLRDTFADAIILAFGAVPNWMQEVATLAGVSVRAVRNWVRKQNAPQLEHVFALGRASDVIKAWYVRAMVIVGLAQEFSITEFMAAEMIDANGLTFGKGDPG